MEDWEKDMVALGKRLNAQMQQGNTASTVKGVHIDDDRLDLVQSGQPPQGNKSGYQLGKFRHESETSPKGQVMLPTTPHATTPNPTQPKLDVADQPPDLEQEAAMLASRLDPGKNPPATMKEGLHKNTVESDSPTVSQSSQTPVASGPEPTASASKDKESSKGTILDRYSDKTKQTDPSRTPDKTPQQDKDHER